MEPKSFLPPAFCTIDGNNCSGLALSRIQVASQMQIVTSKLNIKIVLSDDLE